ncbi:MAG: hypothetical protein MUO23_12160, partial [Anaerolineales bacterium]|nr:hypothetical protein [Anaerolineales bacterium]
MTSSRLARLLRFSVAFLGAAMTVVAVLAYPLGLDNNPELGSSRAALLALGLLLVWLATGPVLGRLFRRLAGAAKSRLGLRRPAPRHGLTYDDASPGAASAGSLEPPAADNGLPHGSSSHHPKLRLRQSTDGWTIAFLLAVLAAAVLTAWWLGTAGTWTDWPA